MRVVYVLIAVFLLLCVFFTQWYLCDARGLCAFPIAINEILLMLLASFFIGFAASWLLREPAYGSLRKQSSLLAREKTALKVQLNLLETENQSTRRHLTEWQQDAKQQRNQREELIREAQSRVTSLEEDLQQHQRRYENLKQENDEVRISAERLKRELEAERSRLEVPKTENAEETAVNEHEVMMEEGLEVHELFRSRFTPSTWQTKDDLSLISGIGPVLHKKLNDLGIYSFQQLSELTPGMVRQIANAIKFFPDRIGRDNWIGQAAAFMKRK